MQDKIIEVRGLCCVSGNRYLLQNIDWEVNRGENWLLFGNNGCGKTTLLSVLAGFRQYDAGVVRVFGQAYTAASILPLRQRIGWVSSAFFDRYYHSERALDIVLSGLTGGLGKGFAVRNALLVRAYQLLEALHLGDKMERPFDLLSKGERQNVLIARALVTEPELLLLDEPGTGLDVFAREQMLETIGRLSGDGQSTIVYVTHYPEEILPSFDHCLLLKNGAVYRAGATETLFGEACLSGLADCPVQVVHERGRVFVQMAETRDGWCDADGDNAGS